uniref:Histone-lysine N-methyltransferase PRDM9 n=1 Tax=Magallana gigas TaxID=29159 RepID=K1Q027_MAGGI
MDCKTIAQKAPTGWVSQGFESPWGRWFLTPAVITLVLSLDWCFSFTLRPTGLQETTNQCESQGAGLVTLDSAEKERALTQFIEVCEDFQKYGEKSKSYTFIKNAKIPLHFDPEERANLTTPEGFRIELSTIPGAGFGGFTERFVPKHTILGSYEGLTHLHHREDDLYSWQVEKVDSEGVYMIDAGSPAHSNWLRWLNCAGNVEQENVVAVACAGLILYMTTRDIEPGSEMFVWYGDGYGDYLKINRVHPESDLQGIFNIRASILSFDEDDRTVYSDGTPVTFTNWVPEAASDFVDNEFGLVLTYNGSNWKWFPEKDYRYFTGPEGLHLPYVCEDKTTYNEDGVIDPEYTEEDEDSVTERFPEKVVPPLPGQGLLKPDVVCDHIV